MNGVTTVNYMRPLPGWDTFDVMLLPYLYDYFNAAGFTRNTVREKALADSSVVSRSSR